MSHTAVTLKAIEPIRVLGIRTMVERYTAIGPICGELKDYIAKHGIVPTGALQVIWYDEEYRESDVDGEAVLPVDEGVVAESDRVSVHVIPGYESAATAIHQGGYDSLPETYQVINAWISEFGYQITGPIREVYLQMDPGGDPTEYRTEIQFPVSK